MTPALTLLAGCCAAPTCSVSNTSVHVTWDAVPGAALYEVHFGVAGEQEFGSQTSASNSAIVTDLQPSTTYNFRMRASKVNEVSGWLDWSTNAWTCATPPSSGGRKKRHKPVIIDVRTPSEWAAGHISCARGPLPIQDNPPGWERRVANWTGGDKAVPIITVSGSS